MALVEFEGKNTEEAINNAASTLRVPPEFLEFTILSTGSKGFLGLGSQKAKILVDTIKSLSEARENNSVNEDGFDELSALELDDNTKSQLKKKTSSREELIYQNEELEEAVKDGDALYGHLPTVAKSSTSEGCEKDVSSSLSELRVVSALFEEWRPEGFFKSDFAALPFLVFRKEPIVLPRPLTQPLAKEITSDSKKNQAFAWSAKDVTLQLLSLMGFSAEVSMKTYKDRIILNILCAENALIIGRRGVGLDAMELLVNKIAKRKEFKFSRTRIIVDAEDYRARRHVGIIQKAFVLANEAIHTNKIQGLPQLTSSERMLTRIAMNYVTGVSTRTLGGGALRNIQLVPSGKEKRQKSQ